MNLKVTDIPPTKPTKTAFVGFVGSRLGVLRISMGAAMRGERFARGQILSKLNIA